MKHMLRISTACLRDRAIACVAILAADGRCAEPALASRPESRAGTWDFFIPLHL